MTAARPVLAVALLAVAFGPLRAEEKADSPPGTDAPVKAKPVPASPTAADKALLERYRSLPERIDNPAAKEAMNWGDPWFLLMVERLAGEKPATEKSLAAARFHVEKRCKEIEALADFPRPKSFKMPRAAGEITIDGVLDDAGWKGVERITEFYPINQAKPQAESRNAVGMAWDANYLYFAFRCRDDSIEAPELPRDGAVYNFDCIELFLLPNPRFGMYWELNYSPTGSIFDALGCKYRNKFMSYHRAEETIEGLQAVSKPFGPPEKPEGFIVEVAFPIDQLPGWTPRAEAGNTIHILATRVSRDEGKNTFLAFTPIAATFHNIWCYAPVTLTD